VTVRRTKAESSSRTASRSSRGTTAQSSRSSAANEQATKSRRPAKAAGTAQSRTARSAKKTGEEPWRGVPKQAHEWVSFPDPDYERTWMFDVTFLESRWTCIFGRGCQGVLTGPAPELVQGCCSYGAHLTGQKDARRVQNAAATLTPEQWEFHDRAWAKGAKKPQVIQRKSSGELTTKLVKGACIFLNRPGFGAGPGCALHQAANARGIPHLKLKPDVCWQLPLRRDDEVGEGGHVTAIIRQWDRRDWGKGGAEFHWWCTESPEAFVGERAAYEELENELREMVGPKIHKRLVAYLEDRRSRLSNEPTPVSLPHPALRRRAVGS
jgi:hypothetical protein